MQHSTVEMMWTPLPKGCLFIVRFMTTNIQIWLLSFFPSFSSFLSLYANNKETDLAGDKLK
jgi:hypothetical protein